MQAATILGGELTREQVAAALEARKLEWRDRAGRDRGRSLGHEAASGIGGFARNPVATSALEPASRMAASNVMLSQKPGRRRKRGKVGDEGESKVVTWGMMPLLLHCT